MSEFKIDPGAEPQDLTDAVSARAEEDGSRDANDLPVNTYDDYKTWCDKIRQEWDIN